MNGSASRLVISQPEATLYIQPPTFDTTVAVQISANVRWRNGAHTEAVARGSLMPAKPNSVALYGLGAGRRLDRVSLWTEGRHKPAATDARRLSGAGRPRSRRAP